MFVKEAQLFHDYFSHPSQHGADVDKSNSFRCWRLIHYPYNKVISIYIWCHTSDYHIWFT